MPTRELAVQIVTLTEQLTSGARSKPIHVIRVRHLCVCVCVCVCSVCVLCVCVCCVCGVLCHPSSFPRFFLYTSLTFLALSRGLSLTAAAKSRFC